MKAAWQCFQVVSLLYAALTEINSLPCSGGRLLTYAISARINVRLKKKRRCQSPTTELLLTLGVKQESKQHEKVRCGLRHTAHFTHPNGELAHSSWYTFQVRSLLIV